MPTFTTHGPVAVDVSMESGRLVVETHDEPTTSIELEPLRDDAGTAQAVADATVEHVEHGGRHEITVRLPKGGRGGLFGRSPKVLVRVRAPVAVALRAETRSADVLARCRLGDTDVKTQSGDVALDAVDGALRVGTMSGDVAAGLVGGDCVVNTVSGDAEIEQVGGALEGTLVSGDARVGSVGGEVKLQSVSGDIELGSVGAAVRVQTVSGDVQLSMRAGLRLWIDAQSMSGRVSSALDVADTPEAVGEGPAVEVRVRSVSGDVVVGRAAEIPA